MRSFSNGPIWTDWTAERERGEVMSPQLLLARLANELYDAVGKERYFSDTPLRPEDWQNLDLAWKRILVDQQEEVKWQHN